MSNNLQHIAIIMDGNGRWAQAKGLPRSAGHKRGSETLQNIAKAVAEMKIKYLTVYAFSTENWRRPQEEVDYLMGLLRQYLKSELKEIKERGARIRFIGEKQMLPEDIVGQMNKIEMETADKDEFTLCIALSYGARQEIAAAAKKIAAAVVDGKMNVSEINEQTVADCLYTSDIPDPDVVIRTGGEKRMSNYLLWQIAYSELFFTPTLWPDFSAAELNNILTQYQSRERRYGQV